MKIAIMQPYAFAYIGYFQLINAVDEFIVYDNIEFTKKGWINRNRILVNGSDSFITLPLKKDSDYLTVKDRYFADGWFTERKKILNKISECYKKAPQFNSAYPVIEKCFLFDNLNLFQFIYNSIKTIMDCLNITTPLTISSSLNIDHNLKSENKVVEICRVKQADKYINPMGGVELYSKQAFLDEGIKLSFLKPGNINYSQFNNDFVPHLSIIDVMMFNDLEEIKLMLNNYELV